MSTGIEDKESWHGKPLPKNMADQIIQEIYSQVQSKKKILATPPQEDAPSVDIANIRMPTPPSYKVGDKVPHWLFCELLELGWGCCFGFLRSMRPRCGFWRAKEGESRLSVCSPTGELYAWRGSERPGYPVSFYLVETIAEFRAASRPGEARQSCVDLKQFPE